MKNYSFFELCLAHPFGPMGWSNVAHRVTCIGIHQPRRIARCGHHNLDKKRLDKDKTSRKYYLSSVSGKFKFFPFGTVVANIETCK